MCASHQKHLRTSWLHRNVPSSKPPQRTLTAAQASACSRAVQAPLHLRQASWPDTCPVAMRPSSNDPNNAEIIKPYPITHSSLPTRPPTTQAVTNQISARHSKPSTPHMPHHTGHRSVDVLEDTATHAELFHVTHAQDPHSPPPQHPAPLPAFTSPARYGPGVLSPYPHTEDRPHTPSHTTQHDPPSPPFRSQATRARARHSPPTLAPPPCQLLWPQPASSASASLTPPPPHGVWRCRNKPGPQGDLAPPMPTAATAATGTTAAAGTDTAAAAGTDTAAAAAAADSRRRHGLRNRCRRRRREPPQLDGSGRSRPGGSLTCSRRIGGVGDGEGGGQAGTRAARNTFPAACSHAHTRKRTGGSRHEHTHVHTPALPTSATATAPRRRPVGVGFGIWWRVHRHIVTL